MKLSIRFFGAFASLLLLWAPAAFSQPYASYDHGRKVYYTPSATQLLVQFTDAATLARRGKSPALLGVQAVKVLTALPGVALLEVGADSPLATVQQLVVALRRDADVVQAAPVLLNAAGKPFGGVTDQFIVKLNATATLADLQGLLKQTGAVLHHPYEFEAHTYFLSVDKSKGDALTMANRFYESGLCEYAEPNFVLFVEPTGTANDPLYSQQWALNNTGQTGGSVDADMDVAEAWDITTGASSVRVAVLDNGVDLSHPDLINQLDPGYDATGGGNNGGIVTTSDLHGTGCAGIVGAQGNNGLGVAGVAYSCRLVPVRVYGSGSPTITTAGWMAAGIDWARQYNRADVLSLSFGITVGQQLITDAIHRAVTQGRNTLGCLVLAAAGNDNGPLSFPGSAPEAIAVGSSENTDHRTYDSNYGTGLDIVAPGEGIYTTDVHDSPAFTGYVVGDYVSFRGTSAATPNAAGVAALVLSVAPGLTATQVRQILESSTDKVNTGDYAYSLGAGENPGLTWNNQMGYGRVNAYNAVVQARQAVCSPDVAGSYYNGSGYHAMEGFNYVTSGSVSISVSTPVGANCTFTISPSNYFTITKQGPTSAYFQIGPASSPSQQRAQVDIVTQTPCGTSSGSFQFYVPGYNYQAAPNPAVNELTVMKVDEGTPTTSTSARTSDAARSTPPYEAALYDSFGQQVRLVKSAQGKAVLDVRSLPNGLYNLRVGQGKDAFTEHIQIAH